MPVSWVDCTVYHILKPFFACRLISVCDVVYIERSTLCKSRLADCQRSQVDRVVSSNCPQMRRQQELVSRILIITNRSYQGVSHRAGADPEYSRVDIERIRRGFHVESNRKERVSPAEGKHQRKGSLHLSPAPPHKTKRDAPTMLEKQDDTIDDPCELNHDIYTSSSLGIRSMTLIRPVPKARPTVCDSPMKQHIGP